MIGVSANAVSIALVLSYLLVACGNRLFSLFFSHFLLALPLSHALCVDSKRLRVYVENVPVFAGTTRSAKLPKLLKVWKMDNCGTRRDH